MQEMLTVIRWKLQKSATAEALRSKTHAGESMHVFVSPAGGVKWSAPQRQKYELNIEDYETLYAFTVERAKYNLGGSIGR